MVDQDGHIWFGTWRDGVSCYDGQRFENFGFKDGLLSDSIKALLEDREGQIWVGSAGGGVNRYSGAQFNNFTTADGLVDDHVMYVLEDSKGILWFGTWVGVSRYDGKDFTTLTEVSPNSVWHIEEDQQGNIWFGTMGSGVYRYDGVKTRQFTTADGLPNDKVITIVARRRRDDVVRHLGQRH